MANKHRRTSQAMQAAVEGSGTATDAGPANGSGEGVTAVAPSVQLAHADEMIAKIEQDQRQTIGTLMEAFNESRRNLSEIGNRLLKLGVNLPDTNGEAVTTPGRRGRRKGSKNKVKASEDTPKVRAKHGSKSSKVLKVVRDVAGGKSSAKTIAEIFDAANKSHQRLARTDIISSIQAMRAPRSKDPKIGMIPAEDENPRGNRYYAL